MYGNRLLGDYFSLGAVAGYGYGDHTSDRIVNLGSLTEQLRANYDSHTAYGGLRLSCLAVQNEWCTLVPQIGASFSHFAQGSFRESGDQAVSLILHSADASSIVGSVGLQTRFRSLSDRSSLHPLALIQYERDFYASSNRSHDIDAAHFSDPSRKFRFAGQNRGPDLITLGLGLGSDVRDRLQAKGSLVYTSHSNGSELGGRINISYDY